MHPLIRCGLLVLLLTLSSPALRAEPDEAKQKEASRAFFQAVISDLLTDPVTAPYFPGAKTKDFAIDGSDRSGGWMEEAGYSHHVKHAPPPPAGAQGGYIWAPDGDSGIIFNLFTDYDHGGGKVSRTQSFTVSEKLQGGFELRLGKENVALENRIEAIVRRHLFDLKKAVDSPRSRLTFERGDGVWVAGPGDAPAKKISRGQCPALSSDGTRLVFNTVQDDGQPAHRQIAIADLGTGKITILDKIPSTNCMNSQWSPDGKRILFTFYVDNDSHVGLVNADGTGFRPVADNKDAKQSYWAVTWNAKGTGFFAEDMENLYLLDLDGRVLKKWPITKLVPGGDMSGSTRLEASPDGKSLLMDVGLDEKARDGWDGPFPSIWVLDLKTEKATRITPPGFYAWDGQWLEPSASILFTSQGAKDKDSSIYMMSIGDEGRDKKLLFKNARYPGAP